MCDERAVYKLIQLCAAPETTSDERKAYYLEALNIVRNPTKDKYAEDFKEWYNNYPHKVARGYAEKAYTKARKETEHLTLMMGVEWYKRNKPQETPWAHPASWLNAKRWEDGQYEIKPPQDLDLPEWKALLAKRIGPAQVLTWFSKVEYSDGVFTVSGKHSYDWIKNNYSQSLGLVFGEYELVLSK